MNHLAIMNKSLGLTSKILSGQKKIDSRFYKSKYAPWDRIKSGEIIYFKNSGSEVSVKATVYKVIQFSNLTPKKIKKIFNIYKNKICISIEDISKFIKINEEKNYCILIFLKNPRKIKPFNINKKGFGNMSSWICVDNINEIKI